MKLIYLLLLAPMLAFGTGNEVDVRQSNDMNTATTGDVSVGGGSTTLTSTDDTNVYALSLEFPSLQGCIGGGQGGIRGDNGGGFLGLNLTNVACWMQQLSESEEDLDIRARLKCGDRHYRDAITFDVKGRKTEKVQACIDYVTPKWEAVIKSERMTASKYKAQLECAYVGGNLTADLKCVKDE